MEVAGKQSLKGLAHVHKGIREQHVLCCISSLDKDVEKREVRLEKQNWVE